MQANENCGLPMMAVLVESFVLGLPASWGGGWLM